MAKVKKVQSKSGTAPFLLPSRNSKISKENHPKRHFDLLDKKQWDDATCSVCMESPHNAVLLLCSSYHKGCRPYMCATGRRYSNCLEQYKKAYTKVNEAQSTELGNESRNNPCSNYNRGHFNGGVELPELLCPLCRGQVKGWTVVEAARKYLNRKKRTCMHDKCTFLGNYKELRKHVKAEHPSTRPRAVDPAREAKWKRFEQTRERDDVISSIISSVPGAIVLGDYVIEPNYRNFFSGDELDEYSSDDMLEPLDRESGNRIYRNHYIDDDYDRYLSQLGSFASASNYRRMLFGNLSRRRRQGGSSRNR